MFLTSMIFWICVLLINLARPRATGNQFMRDASFVEKISWKNRFDIAVIGDCRTQICISPEAMENILPGFKIGNLGFVALIYSQDYMDYVRNSLKSPVKNKVIIICFNPRSLLSNEKSECFFRKYSEDARIPLKIELDRHSEWLQKLFRELSVGDFSIRFFDIDHIYLNLFFKSGWAAARLFPENVKRSYSEYRNYFTKSKIDNTLLEVIYRNTEIWTHERIKVFGIRIPISPGLLTIENKLSGFDEQKIRNEFQKCGGTWLEPDSKYFIAYDGNHARYDSAIIYSKSLAKELKKNLQ